MKRREESNQRDGKPREQELGKVARKWKRTRQIRKEK